MQRSTRPNHRRLALCAALLGLLGLSACGPSAADVRKQQEQSRYHYQLGYGHYFNAKSKNVNQALQETLRALRLDPDYADAHLLAGLIFLGRDQFLKAINHFQRALEIQPDFHYAKNNLGATYLAMERWQDAKRIYGELTEVILYSDQGMARNNLGWAFYKTGDLQRARTEFITATQLQPDLCPPYNNLGMVLIDLKNYIRAEKMLRRGLKQCPKYAEPHYHLGRVLQEKGDLPGARAEFAKCVELSVDTPLGDRCRSRVNGLTSNEEVAR